jgi:AcrR family transcriptional regulator
MPKVSDEHREQRRQQILDAAMRSFASKGFDDTVMSDIFAEAGLSAGAVYGHFEGKREILTAVAEAVLDGGRLPTAPAREADGRPTHPIDFADRFATRLIDHVGGAALPLQVWGRAAADPALHAVFDAVFPRIVDAFSEQIAVWLHETRGLSVTRARERGRPLASVLAGLLQGAIVQLVFIPDFDRAAYLAESRPIFDTINA